MRMPSVVAIWQEARHAFLRFPAVLVAALTAAWVAIDLVGDEWSSEARIRLLLVAALAIPLFLALRLFREKTPWGRPVPAAAAWGLTLAGLLLLAAYRYLLKADPGEAAWLRYVQITLAVDLAIAFAAFLGPGEENGFWQFNRRLFLRSFLSAIYAAVFFGGLALAIAAVDHLFDVEVNEIIYPRLWLFTVFVFQTWHFLAGVPRDLPALESDREHPKALRIFSQSMLLPLVVLYLAILYAYMGRILLTRQWPHGWVGWLVSFAGGFGLLTLLLLHPGREEGRDWRGRFARGFYAAILPLLGLLFVALAKRVGQYGMTERRYFLMILGAWLGGVALYMLLSRSRSIKVVPISLALTALCTSCGPWGAYQVSQRSQHRRLEALMVRHDLLVDGRIVAARRTVPFEDRKEMSAIASYLVSTHGPEALQRWGPPVAAPEAIGSDRRREPARTSEEFMEVMGLEHVPGWETAAAPRLVRADDGDLEIAGYERLVMKGFAGPTSHPDRTGDWARLSEDGRAIEVLKGTAVRLTAPLEPIARRLAERGTSAGGPVPAQELCLEATGGDLRAKVCFLNLYVENEPDGGIRIMSGDGYLFVAERPSSD